MLVVVWGIGQEFGGWGMVCLKMAGRSPGQKGRGGGQCVEKGGVGVRTRIQETGWGRVCFKGYIRIADL